MSLTKLELGNVLMEEAVSRLFAIVPAAGFSRRMGQPKLLLPWGESTVIASLLTSLKKADVTQTCVVVRRDDDRLRIAIEAEGGWCVSLTVDPPDMRASVEFGLAEIRRRFHPRLEEGWLLIPADHPAIDVDLLRELIQVWKVKSPQILVPRHGIRRGHPTFFRWWLADEIRQIPPEQGLNWLLRTYDPQVVEVSVDQQTVLADLDTPDDYEQLKRLQSD